jgi:hypothetical protein
VNRKSSKDDSAIASNDTRRTSVVFNSLTGIRLDQIGVGVLNAIVSPNNAKRTTPE